MYADHCEVDGVVFAFWDQKFASGRHTGSTTITGIIVTSGFPDGEWVLPPCPTAGA